MKAWIQAMRLRTLPLAIASIGMAGFLAFSNGVFNPLVFLFCLLTTVSLQILSNLANDYGDSVHGADHDEREGPKRSVQSGVITQGQMKRAIYINIVVSFILGITLLLISDISTNAFISFLGFGIMAIVAAILYTNGKLPYGYIGLGDISVFMFFGILAVVGTYYLQTGSFYWSLLFPASSVGLLAVGVLNINNIRDIDSDVLAGKRSLPVMMGKQKARYYHVILLLMAMVSALLYIFQSFEGWYHYIFLAVVPLIVLNGKSVFTKYDVPSLDPLLKQLALTTVLFVVLFGISINLS